MILNFRFSIVLIFTSFITFYLTLMFFVKSTLTTNFYDIITHLYINDFFINNYYFLWTQFFLLPTLLIYIIYYYTILKVKNKNIILVFSLTILLLMFLWWVIDYYISNNYSYFTKNIEYFFNNLLYNPLNKYHPILFFISYIYIYMFMSYINFFTSFHNNYTNNISNILYKISIKQVNFYWVSLSFSLYLGSWWALQEGSWGGWWNWDASEVFGLLILTFILYIFHMYHPTNTKIHLLIVSYLWVSIIFLLYIILQMSYTLVSHNFGLSILGYGYVSFNFTCLGLLTLLFLYTILNILLKNMFLSKVHFKNIIHIRTYYFINQSTLSKQSTILFIITLLTLYIYILSFNPIINNICWTSFNLEILNKLFVWVNPKLLLLVLIFIILWPLNLVTLSIIFQNILNFYNIIHLNPLVLYFVPRTYYFTTFHILILITFISSIYLDYSLYTIWEYFNMSNVSWQGIYKRSLNTSNIIFDNIYISNSVPTLNSNTLLNSNSFFWFDNSLNSQFFMLDLNEILLKQSVYNHTFLYTFNISVYDISSLVSDIPILILTVITLYFYFKKIKIIF